MVEHVLNIPLQTGKGFDNPALIIEDEKLDPVLVNNRAVKIHTQTIIILELLQSIQGPQKTVLLAEQDPAVVAIGFQPGWQIIFGIICDCSGFQLALKPLFSYDLLKPAQFRDRQ